MTQVARQSCKCSSKYEKRRISIPMDDFPAIEVYCDKCGVVVHRYLFERIAREAKQAYQNVVNSYLGIGQIGDFSG